MSVSSATINHSRPYTFESRRGPHYYPNRVSSPTLADGTTVPSKTNSTTSSQRTRSPPLHPDDIFQPPSLGEKSRANTHLYNQGAVRAPAPAYADPYMYNYNPAVDNWADDTGGFTDYSKTDGIGFDMVEFSRRRLLARTRFILRLLAMLFSVAVVAGLGSAIATYYGTRDDGLMWNGEPVWHPDMDQNPSNALIAIGGAAAFTSLVLLILSAWARFRHVSFMSNLTNIVVSSTNMALAIFGIIYFARYKGSKESPTFWSWVCDGKKVDDPLVQFKILCGETRFSYGSAYAVVGLEALVLLNVIVGWLLLGRNGVRNGGEAKGRVVVQVRKAEKKKGEWKGNGY